MKDGRRQVSWDLNTECRYSCSYCFLHGRNPAPPGPATLFLSPREWAACWDRFNDRHGPCRIHVSGGEPFLYPGFMELLPRLAARNEVCVISNFSGDLSPLPALVPAGRLRLVLSLHPEHVPDPAAFLARAAALKTAGLRIVVTSVAYPPLLEKLLSCSRMCASLGLKFVATPFFGSWEKRHYPESYEKEEKEKLLPLLDDPSHALFQFQEASPLGRECRAGADYCRIAPDGSVRTCLNGPLIGAFTDPAFRLPETALACPSEHCHCLLEFKNCLPRKGAGRG